MTPIRPEGRATNPISKSQSKTARLPAMSSVPAFISELIRAANEVEKLAPNEMSRLLDQSVDTIRDIREQAGRFGSRRARDVLIDLQVAPSRATRRTSSGRFGSCKPVRNEMKHRLDPGFKRLITGSCSRSNLGRLLKYQAAFVGRPLRPKAKFDNLDCHEVSEARH